MTISRKVLLAIRHIRRIDLCESYGCYLSEQSARPFEEEDHPYYSVYRPYDMHNASSTSYTSILILSLTLQHSSLPPINNIFLDYDITFDANGEHFILMAGDSICINVTVIDDDVNEAQEWFHFGLYHHNGFVAERIDQTRFRVIDNEDGQLIISYGKYYSMHFEFQDVSLHILWYSCLCWF